MQEALDLVSSKAYIGIAPHACNPSAENLEVSVSKVQLHSLISCYDIINLMSVLITRKTLRIPRVGLLYLYL